MPLSGYISRKIGCSEGETGGEVERRIATGQLERRVAKEGRWVAKYTHLLQLGSKRNFFLFLAAYSLEDNCDPVSFINLVNRKTTY